MEIPQNILKELEEKKAESLLNRKNEEPVMASSTEAPQRMTFVPPISPVQPVSTPLLEADPHHHSGGELFFEFLAKASIYLAVFLTPILFFNSSDPVNLSKQLVLGVLALTAMMAWVGKTIASGKMTWRKSILFGPAILIAVAAMLSSFFSSSFWISFLGDAGRLVSSGLSILSYLIILLTALQVFGRKDLKMVLYLWLSSVFVTAAYALCQFFGIYLIPSDLYKVRTFNSVGTPYDLALFVLSAFPFIVALMQHAQAHKVKIFLAVLALTILATTVIVGFQTGWIVLALSILALIVMNFRQSAGSNSHNSYQKNILMPMVVIMLAAVFWFMGPLAVKDLNFSPEVSPSYGASLSILGQGLKDKPVFGSGLETFSYVYAKFKSADLNQTNYWGTNFNNASAEVITWITTTGIFGALAWFFFVLIFIWYAFKKLMEGDSHGLSIGIFSSWIFILLSKFFYSTSLPLELMFWFLPVVFVLSLADFEAELKSHSYYFQSGSTKTLIAFFVLMVVLLGTLAGIYFSVRRWQAEASFTAALNLPDTAERRDDKANAIYSAIGSDNYESRYFQVLTQVLFGKMNDIVSGIQSRPQGQNTAKPEEATLLKNLTSQTISTIQRATELDPQNVNVIINTAQSYSGLAPLVQGADDLSIQQYEKAVTLEPINPFIRTQLAQAYLTKSGLLSGSAINKEFVDKAKASLDEALKLNPNYANAKYFTALIYDYQGERTQALQLISDLNQTNPNNQVLTKILQNLQQGLPALGTPPQAPTPPQPTTGGPAQGLPVKGGAAIPPTQPGKASNK